MQPHDIPLEYFVKAINWLRTQPRVAPDRVWSLSVSRGTEAGLLVAAHWPGLVHGVAAAAPSSIGYSSSPGRCRPRGPVAWTWHGHPIPHVVIIPGTRNADGSISDRSGFEATLGTPTATAAQIPIARFHGPALLISGGDDQLWPSSTYADQIMQQLRSDPAPHVHLNYPAAGHIVFGIPYVPLSIEEQGPRFRIDLGGTPAADDAAHRSDWPAAVRFITTR